MNTIPELVALCDSRAGRRVLLEVAVSQPDRKEFSQEQTEGTEKTEEESQKQTKKTEGTEGTETVLDFVSSTATLDRYHEIIEPAGWRLDSYRRNPVFQNAHNYGDILFTLGKALVTEVRDVGGRQALCQRIQFATEVNPVARIAYGLYSGGFLNAVSVGFIPLRWEDGQGEREASGQIRLTQPSPTEPVWPSAERAASPRRRYLEQELLEVSAVAIPANPDALALGVKAGAIAKSDLREAMALFRALAGAQSAGSDRQGPPPYVGGYGNQWLELAREFGRVMQKA